jgi:hypothetical protein
MKLATGDDGLLMGLPDWPTLMNNLYAIKELPPTIYTKNTNFPQVAEDFRLQHCNGNNGYWLDCVSKALYAGGDLDFSLIRKNGTLEAIGALVRTSLRGAVSEIVTLNFDDVLDRYLAIHGIVVVPTFEEKCWASRGDIVIYHPHGFLPSPGSCFQPASSFVVLDRSSYSKSAPIMNQKMKLVMQSHICLFIGLSGEDERLDKLIWETKDEGNHAYNTSQTGYWGVAFSASYNQAKARKWEERRIYLQKLDDYHTDLPNFLFEICQSAASR